MCLVSAPKIPEPAPIQPPPLPPKTAEKVGRESPNPTRKSLSSRRIGKKALTIPRNTGLVA